MIILGDNPFFGVNHASAERALGYFRQLQARDWSSALATMRAALDHGVDHFMVSTHSEAPELLSAMRADPMLDRFSVVPAVPYLYRLNGLVASAGVPAAMIHSVAYGDLVRSLWATRSIPAAALSSFISREVEGVADIGFPVPFVALQNIFVDLLLSLGQARFISAVADLLQAQGRKLVAITMNPLLADRLLGSSVILCTHYNIMGYMVQPDLVAVQRWVEKTARPVWAMGVMASGQAPLDQVLADPYLAHFSAVVVGASRPASIAAFASGYAASGAGRRAQVMPLAPGPAAPSA